MVSARGQPGLDIRASEPRASLCGRQRRPAGRRRSFEVVRARPFCFARRWRAKRRRPCHDRRHRENDPTADRAGKGARARVEGAIGSEVRHQFGQREINRMSLKTLSIVSLLLTASLVSYSASGKFIQQGEKLVGTGGSISTAQGRSTALSADGNTAIVGGPNDSPYGAAWIFVRDADGAW